MGARVILAGINAATIGTDISIILPVVSGLFGGNPSVGVIALVWGLLYQQAENLTIEPKISARAVDVNPSVSFGAVLLGAALFGVAGAFLSVPVTAMLLLLLNIYGHRYDLLPDVQRVIDESSYKPKPKRSRNADGPEAGPTAAVAEDLTTA